MLKLYDHPAPNPAKVALFLEEAGLPYEVVPVDIRKGEQHLPAFAAINPNAKAPALVDGDAVLFDSNAILLYLAETLPYAVNRYDFEAWRHWRIVEAQLSRHAFMLGDCYTLVDMAVWGWARAVPFVLGAEAWQELPSVKRWFDLLNARPAAHRVDALKVKYSFKAEMDDEARRAMFPQNARLLG